MMCHYLNVHFQGQRVKVILVHVVCVTVKQDSQGTYKATMRRVAVTIVDVEKQ